MEEFEDFDFDFEAAERVGAKVIEAANRVAKMHQAIPGARATWHFEIDDARFCVCVTVADQAEGV